MTALFNVLPAVFTPELDRAYPPSPLSIRGAGYVWLTAVVASFSLVMIGYLRGKIPPQLRRPAGLLLASVAFAPMAFFMVGSDYVRPRHILPLYPLACILLSAAVEVARQKIAHAWPVLIIAILVLSGVAVHLISLGPPTIHGAGEQEWRQPAVLIDEMVVDLDRHRVQCLFSESPMLQWNLMFASHERIAARWITAQDRWQPYVDRVNRAFTAGAPCALLLVNMPGKDRLAILRAHFGEKSDRLTVFNDRYALLYEIPPTITKVFKQ